jgi:hypothetical protein
MLKSVAQQSVEELGGRISVLSRQKSDHVTLDDLLRQLSTASAADQDRLLPRIYRLVFPHAFAEESVLWPVMRRALSDGHELTLEVEREHQEVNELVQRLDALQPGSLEREAILERLIEVLREDVRDEEDLLFPRLQTVVSPTRLRLLGVLWEVVRRTAPTRAHPIVARRPPGNVLAALPLSLLDRLRDVADSAAHRSPSAMKRMLGSMSAALANTSSAVERLPIMRTGEDPSTHVPVDRRAQRAGLALAVALAVAIAGLLVVRRRR